MTESSRFRMWPKPTAYPFYDVITSDTTPGEVFDIGVDLDGYDGSVFIKTEHIEEMARSLGMATKAEVDLLIYENKRLQAQINVLPDRTDLLKNGLADLVQKFHLSLAAISTEFPAVEDEPKPADSDTKDDGNDGSADSTNSGKKSTKASGDKEPESDIAEELGLSI